MKKTLGLILFLSLFFITFKAEGIAQGAFGVIDRTIVLTESELGNMGFKHIQDLQTQAEEALVDLEKKIDALDESDEDKELRKQLELQAAVYTLQTNLEQEQNIIVEIIEKALEDAIMAIRKEKGISMVFTQESVLSYDEKYDMTKDVITYLNKQKVEFPEMPEIKLPNPVELPKAEEKKE